MSGKTDVVKGRIKEAAGALTGNDKLRAEGKADQTVGEVKQVADNAVDKVKEAVKNYATEVAVHESTKVAGRSRLGLINKRERS